ncbi:MULTISPECIES: hypothetical protein [unclassified Pseudomonas]|uniref:hypothetical protein n=1 Tax=unclassified Pseudomonas TaxID=196821 RepID=UPI0030DA6AD5
MSYSNKLSADYLELAKTSISKEMFAGRHDLRGVAVPVGKIAMNQKKAAGLHALAMQRSRAARPQTERLPLLLQIHVVGHLLTR